MNKEAAAMPLGDKPEEAKQPKCEEKEAKEAITSEYECTQNCFTCPFPGAKCVANPQLWNHLT